MRKKFGRWIVIKEVARVKYEKRKLLVKCECGTQKIVRVDHLNSGKSTSCGCYSKESHTIHGCSDHPLYQVWKGMIHRCYNKSNKDYYRYGGRGIRVYKLWYHHPEKFVEWSLKNGWEKGLEIDRKNNDEGYKPSNCRFVTRRKNQNNKRNTIKVIFRGKEIPFAILHRKYGDKNISYDAAKGRYMKCGWPIEKAIGLTKETTYV